MKEQIEQLIKALEKEKNRLGLRGVAAADHDYAIAYLRNGVTTAKNPDRFSLLDAAMNDLKCLCSDYGIKEAK